VFPVTRRPSILQVLLCLSTAACTSGKSESVEYTECGGDTTDLIDQGYVFKDRNFACDTTPIDGDFKISDGFTTDAYIDDASEAVVAFGAAAAVWNAGGADVHVDLDWTALDDDDAKSAGDNEHHVLLKAGTDPDQPNASALTTMQPPYASMAPTDCDIVVYWQSVISDSIEYNNWVASDPPTDAVDPDDDRRSLQMLLLHEIGHCMGFAENRASTASVMNYGDVSLFSSMPSAVFELDSSALKAVYGLE